MTDHCDVIAAFVDNEPVRADELAAALAASLGREYLIDLLVLRGLLGDPGVRVLGAPGLRPHGAPGLSWPERSRGQSRGRALGLTAAAALVAVSVGAGFFAARVTGGGVGGTLPAAADVVAPAGQSASPAPAPTHVIRMERGVDWNERSGGN